MRKKSLDKHIVIFPHKDEISLYLPGDEILTEENFIKELVETVM